MVTMTTEQLAEQTKADAARMRRAPQALLQQCRDVLVDDMRRGIAEGHSPDGTPFAPLAFPRVGGGGGPLLGRNNSIAASIGSVTRYGPDSVEVGTNHPHAAVHQRGGIIRPHGQFLAMPRKPLRPAGRGTSRGSCSRSSASTAASWPNGRGGARRPR
jgi:phage gpG-like protein